MIFRGKLKVYNFSASKVYNYCMLQNMSVTSTRSCWFTLFFKVTLTVGNNWNLVRHSNGISSKIMRRTMSHTLIWMLSNLEHTFSPWCMCRLLFADGRLTLASCLFKCRVIGSELKAFTFSAYSKVTGRCSFTRWRLLASNIHQYSLQC